MTTDLPPEAMLTDVPSVLTFWRETLGRDDVPREVEFLTGGVSSIVVRVVTDLDTYVIKQALPQLRVEAPWFSRPERSINEARAAAALGELVPGSVPETIAPATDRRAFVMRCAPPGSETWKAHLMRGDVSPAVAATVGRLLGRIHAASAERPDLAEAFADQSFFDELRVDPYLRYVAERAPGLAPPLNEVAAQLLSPGRCLVHGDFSPKNLLVAPGGGVLLVDHEVAHWGHPAFDVAFVTSHLALKATRFRARAEEYLGAATAVLDAYSEESGRVTDGTGRFAARVTGALLIARVDGKSPVEYLTDPRDKEIVRALGRDALIYPPSDPWALLSKAREAIARA